MGKSHVADLGAGLCCISLKNTSEIYSPPFLGPPLNNRTITLSHKSGKKHKKALQDMCLAAFPSLNGSHCGQAIHPVFAEAALA